MKLVYLLCKIVKHIKISMIQRSNYEVLKKRIDEKRQFIQVLVGPRQVGKTTLIRQALANYPFASMYESADGIMVDNFTWLIQLWETARLRMRAENSPEFLLVIDEIQKIENWSEIIKQQWDKDTFEGNNIKVVLLGSSRLLIQQGLTESLAGRFETLFVGHWSFSEMREAFDFSLEQFIYYGAYPGAANLLPDEDRWKSYIKDALIETSISKDILMLTRIDKPALLKRLFEIGCLYSGQILSYTKIMGQLQDAGNTTTLANYLHLLSDSGLLGGIDKYAGNVIRKRASSPKFQVYNNALMTAQDTATFETTRLDLKRWGRLVESAIGAHLINASVTEKLELHYWREGNNEVDFVLKKGNDIIALEVKSGMRADQSGMKIFHNTFHPKRTLLVGTGGIPIEMFLTMNPGELF